MNKTLIFTIVLIVLAFILYYVFSAPTPNIQQVPVEQSDNSAPATNTATTTELNVSIKNMAFDPAVVNVKVGTRIVWVNNDSVAHSVDGGSVFKSITLNPGDTFSYLFTTVGTFKYICSIHPSMKAEVIVQ